MTNINDSQHKPHRLNCDNVAWMLNAIDRYLPPDDKDTPPCSQKRDMLKYGLLYEIMEAGNMVFGDESARRNGTPRPALATDIEPVIPQREAMDVSDAFDWPNSKPVKLPLTGLIMGSGGDAGLRATGGVVKEDSGDSARTIPLVCDFTRVIGDVTVSGRLMANMVIDQNAVITKDDEAYLQTR